MTPEVWGVVIAAATLGFAGIGLLVKVVLGVGTVKGDIRVVKEHLRALNGRTEKNEQEIEKLADRFNEGLERRAAAV